MRTDTYTPGYGDSSTWGSCDGHPHDPRTVTSDDEEGLRWSIEDAQELIGRAERAMANGDLQAAIDLLHSAGKGLVECGWSE